MQHLHRFRPKLYDTLPGYTRKQLTKDVAAGLTVGVLALPLAMAFAIASGVSPSSGIWTAIIAGLLISLFGGSRVQIGGPTGAFIPILYAIVVAHGLDNMLAATVMAGVLLLLMGFSGLGGLIRYIPISVVIGFTNGIAVVIFLSQVPDFFGLKVAALPAEFFARMRMLADYAHTLDAHTTALAAGSVVVVVAWSRIGLRYPRLAYVPPQLAALLVGTAVATLFNFPVGTIGSRFGGIPQSLPSFALPLPDLSSIGRLVSPAITIALLGAIESLLSARVADVQVDDKHDPNQELIAQGMANVVVPFVGGIAATGAIARTSTNIRAGGRSPVAGIVHAVTLLAIVLVAAPLAAYVPIATLAAIVMVTAARMGEWHEFTRLKHFTWNYRVVLLSTFLLTVLFDLTIAVEIGMVLASLFFLYRMQALTEVQAMATPPSLQGRALFFSVRGSLFFGAVAKLDGKLDPRTLDTQAVVLDMRGVLNIDTSAIDWLSSLQRGLAKHGTRLLLCGLSAQPDSIVRRSGLAERLGVDNVLPSIEAAEASLLKGMVAR